MARGSVLRRLKIENKISNIESKPGSWRILNHKLDLVDFSNLSEAPIDLQFPLGINDLAAIYPGNIILVAGESNAGKTGFVMQVCDITLKREREKAKERSKEKEKEKERKGSSLDSLLKEKIRYLNSEMAPEEIVEWSKTFGHPLHEEIEFVYRSTDFADAINPKGINIVDYVEVYDEFYKVGSIISDIYNALKGGIAIIVIQKKKGSDFGVGGMFSVWKARLAINLELTGSCVRVAKLAKLKNPTNREDNHEGKQCDYVVSQNGGIMAISEWRYLNDKERKQQNEFYQKHGVKRPKNKVERYEYSILTTNGVYVHVTDKTVQKWTREMNCKAVPSILAGIQESSEVKPFLKEQGWYFQLSQNLQKKVSLVNRI